LAQISRLRSYRSNRSNRKGVAALATVLLVGGIIVQVGVIIGLIAHLVIQITFGARHSMQAFMAARAGVTDGTLKIVRDKNINFSSSGSPYTITVTPDSSATITICRDSRTVTTACDTSNPGKNEVTSLGTSFNRRHRLVAILNVDPITGHVRVESVQEVPLQ